MSRLRWSSRRRAPCGIIARMAHVKTHYTIPGTGMRVGYREVKKYLKWMRGGPTVGTVQYVARNTPAVQKNYSNPVGYRRK